MDGATYLAAAERDAKLAAAIQGALQAMMLTHGGRITMVGLSGTLNFEREMLAMREALTLLAVDPDELTSLVRPPSKRRN